MNLIRALAAQLAGYCSVRLCLASGHFPSKRFLVIISKVFHSFELEVGGVICQL